MQAVDRAVPVGQIVGLCERLNKDLELLRKVLTLATGEGAARVLGVLNAVVLARSLGVREFGVFSSAFAAAVILIVFVDLGQNTHLTRIGSRSLAQCGPRLRDAVVNKMMAMAVIMVVAWFGGSILGLSQDEVFAVALLVVWAGAFSVFESVRAIARARHVFRHDSLANTMESALRLLCIVAATMLHGGIIGIAAAHAVEAVVSAAIYYRWVGRRLNLTSGQYALKPSLQLIRTSFPLGLTMIAMAGFYRLDQVLVRVLSTSAEAGAYAAASRVALAANVVGILVGMAALPGLASGDGDRDASVLRLRETLRLSLVLGLLGTGVLAVGAGLVVRLLFGPEYAAAEDMLRIMSPIVLFNAVTMTANTAIAAFGRERRALHRVYVVVACTILADIFVIPYLGGTGAAAISVVAESAMAVSLLLVVKDMLLPPTSQAQPIAR